MLKLIKTELTKHNGSHTISNVSDIIESILGTSDDFKRTKVQQILAKYSKVSNGKLIIDTSSATDNTYDDLKAQIEKNMRSSETRRKLIVNKKKSESENSSEEIPLYKEKKTQEVPGPRMDYLRKYIDSVSTQKPSDIKSPPKSQYLYGQTKYTAIKRTADKYGPYGTQWVHDTQCDDKLDESAKKSTKIVDRLMEIEYPAQRSEAWFKQRDGKITASDGGTVLGENKYEDPYKFYFKKVKGSPFTGNEACYHGKKFESIATSIYSYRMNVNVIEFGLVDHPKYKFLGASPDGIVGKYKLDGVHKTSLVGRMLEIKVPFRRKILQSGEIKDKICPIYYWDQVQLQLECCDLELCDFWQCNLNEYSSREEFLADTDTSEPFRSQTTGFEKGVLIQLLPRNKIEEASNGNYLTVVYDNASFIYPPKIEMSPEECDLWIAETLSKLYLTNKDCVFDKIIYWKLIESKSVTIERDRAWFKERLPILQKTWDNVEYLRSHKDRAEIAFQYIESLKETKKKNELAIYAIELICNPPEEKADDKTKKLYDAKVAKLIEDTPVVIEMESSDED
jgi:putative phage-type endonuclease